MKCLACVASLGLLMLAVAGPARAVDLRAEIDDAGAGMVVPRVGPCLLANRSRQGPACPEPAVVTGGDNAGRVANRLDRASWFIAMQNLDKARVEADLAVAIDNTDVAARLLRARLAVTLHDEGIVTQDVAVLSAKAPSNPDVQATAAFVLVMKGANLEALREYHRIVSEHPDHLYSREQRARLLMIMHRPDAAVADLNVILEAKPNDRIASALRSEAMQALGRNLPAVADLKAGQDAEPGNAGDLAARADAYARADNGDMALKYYDKLLAILDGGSPLYAMPNDMRAKLLAKRVDVLVRLGKVDRAAEDAAMAARVGGVAATLRAQIQLRRRGFAEVPLDGKDSPELRKGLMACFGQKVCFQGVMRAI